MEVSNAKPIVLSVVDDIFFISKIEFAAKQAGVELVQALNAQQLREHLASHDPRLILVDLNSRSCEPIESIRHIRASPRLSAVRIVGFFSHVQVELERAALEAGCDQVLPRSTFTSNLMQIINSAGRGKAGAN